MLAGGNPSQKSDEGSKRARTDDTVAQEAGVSRDTVQKVEAIQENASSDVVAAVSSGAVT